MRDDEALCVALQAQIGQWRRGFAVLEHDAHERRAALPHREHHLDGTAPGGHRRALEDLHFSTLRQGVGVDPDRVLLKGRQPRHQRPAACVGAHARDRARSHDDASLAGYFDEREGLGASTLLTLWAWDEPTWRRRTEGSAIRRIGWQRWRRNVAVALGNALVQASSNPVAEDVKIALTAARADAEPLVREHIDWALAQGPG